MNEKVTFGYALAKRIKGSKLTIEITEKSVKIHSKLLIKTQNYVSDIVFIVKLGLIPRLFLVYYVIV